MWRRVLNVVGRVLVGTGLLLLLFTAYQIWGTALTESHHQDALRAQLDHLLPPAANAQAQNLARHTTSGVTRPPHPTPTTPPEPAVPATAPTTDAPAEGQPVGSIVIPSIGVNQVVVEGVGTDDLMLGPGHYVGTSLPGQAGNAAIAGHRTTYGRPFYSLDGVPAGAPIIVTTPQGIFTYTTERTEVVDPSDVAVLNQTSDPELTLTTCNPRYSAATRLVLHAKLTASDVFAATSPTTTVPGAATPSTVAHPADPARSRPRASALAGETVSNWVSSVLWGLGVAGALVLTWYLGRRLRPRWAIYAGGTLGVLALLFFFFGAVSPLLPASF